MKFLVTFLLTALLAFAGSLFLPWWIIAVAAFVIALIIPQKPFKAFLAAFLALFILWGIQSSIIDFQNDHLLSTKVASILPLGGSHVLIIIVTAFIGAIVSGMAALTGSLLRRIFRHSN